MFHHFKMNVLSKTYTSGFFLAATAQKFSTDTTHAETNKVFEKSLTQSLSSCFDYRKQLLQAEKFKNNLPMALSGSTPVYLPNDAIKIVLKKLGNKKAIERLERIEKIRSILQSQKSLCLIIPQATVCGDFLIEDRLPINTDPCHNMGIYIENPEFFDDAIRETTRLFFHFHLHDLISPPGHPLSTIVGDCIRYDNFPLYIENENGKKTGKIGLIDLEEIQKKSIFGEPSKDKDFLDPYNLSTLVRIFPYHKKLILEEASKIGMPIDEKTLATLERKGHEYFFKGYIEHRNWLVKKGITRQNTPHSLEIHPERIKKIASIVEKKIVKLNSGQYNFDPMRVKFKDTHLEGRAELLVNLFITHIKNTIEQDQNNYLSMPRNATKPETELVALRSSTTDTSKLHAIIIDKFLQFHDDAWGDYSYAAEILLNTVLKELVKGQELFSFTSNGFFIWIKF